MLHPIQLPSRVNVACEQLDVAIDLFFADRSPVSSLTLAGAAEEILGGALEMAGRKPTLSLRFEERVRMLAKTKFPSPNKDEFIYRHNYPRNAAKRMRPKFRAKHSLPEDQYFRADAKQAAIKMILRALHNQKLLNIVMSEQAHKFYGWHLATIYQEE